MLSALSSSPSSFYKTKWKAPPVAAGSPHPCRGLPSTPFKSLLESLQHIVLCLLPQSIFFIQHLSERCDVSKSFVHLFLPFQLVSQPLAFRWKLHCEHLTSQILTASGLLPSASVLTFFPFERCKSLRKASDFKVLEVFSLWFLRPCSIWGVSGSHNGIESVWLSQIWAHPKTHLRPSAWLSVCWG